MYCQNGGCTFHDKPGGWSPGNGLRGRYADLFRKLGGDIRSLPREDVILRYKKPDQEEVTREVRLSFPEMPMPPGTIPLLEAIDLDSRAMAVAEWLVNRRSEVYLYPDYHKYLYWSRVSPNKLRVAFWHHDKIVGYLDRDITIKSGSGRFMQRSPPDYLFGQHLVADLPGKHVIVVESPMDAILLHGVATRQSRPTAMQVNFLLNCGKIPIWVPDLKDAEGMKFVDVAEEHGHPVSVPSWDFKDPGESFIPNGVLNTAALILDAKGIRYDAARTKINLLGKNVRRV
jgi:hypothetical protein